jgi:hypothetical protein
VIIVPKILSRRLLLGYGAAAVAATSFQRAIASPNDQFARDIPSVGGTGPWDYWSANEGAGPIRILAAAILSANPYNIQSWLFRVGDKDISVYADSGRNTEACDSLRRELYVGLGCAIENACVAAPSQGLKPIVSLFPQATDSIFAARIDLQPTAQEIHPHYNAIALRHTNRNPYRTDRKVEAAVLGALTGLADRPDVKLMFIDPKSAVGLNFIDCEMQSTKFIVENSSLRTGRHKGLRMWLDNGSSLTDADLDKIDLSWIENTRTITCGTAAVFGLIMVRGRRTDHRLHVEAGRLWQRVHLDATVRGVAMQPMNHYMEVIDFGVSNGGAPVIKSGMNFGPAWDGWEPVFGFRAGYSDKVAPPSNRRPLSAVIVT